LLIKCQVNGIISHTAAKKMKSRERENVTFVVPIHYSMTVSLHLAFQDTSNGIGLIQRIRYVNGSAFTTLEVAAD